MSQASPQESRFVALEDSTALEELIARSHREPVMLFKHSLTCPISARAYKEMQAYDGEVALVVVQRAPEVSREVAARTGVRHESPQAIILRDGEARWSASHFDITAAAVAAAAREQR
jgi:bacillithiol system protein YtxJ